MTTSDDGRPTFAAGWYADVKAPGTERWYDGTAWTEHVRPISAPGTVAAAPTAPHADAVSAPVAPANASKRPWFKRKGIVIPVAIVGGIIVVSGIGGALGGGGDDIAAEKPLASQTPSTGTEDEAEEEVEPVMVDVPNVVGLTGADAQAALSSVGLQVDVAGGDVTMPVTTQDVAAGAQAEEGSTVRLTLQEKPKLTLAQENAIRNAEQYLDVMPFSRAGLIQQLSSEYGSGFAAEDAEFAVATLEQSGRVDWNAEAAEAAQSYLDAMAFSRDGLFEQLTSEHGSGFTPDQANAGLAAVGY
ncbi:Ltp family lipoprotein [Microbacterium sp. zg-Y818]|uniref:Ltp family lipoprotein n=1 Tax=unclassified Microbacterium TaxID=2609290 RepID=UPI00214C1F45|nr:MULTISPECIES: Ltp family lipoprotein [unclassified Microbacterium]MCR2799480.1 Ltp family lipoprotein [Microbacterium sp. zg.Y818]WIM21477.1 Ltp family lipoprotein [Microbacterium sp. zg-Y818]